SVGFHTRIGFPNPGFGNVVRLGHDAGLLLLAQLTQPHDRMMRPLRSTAITAASARLRVAPPLDGASVLSASPFGLAPFPSHRRRRFPPFNVRARITLTLPLCRTPQRP